MLFFTYLNIWSKNFHIMKANEMHYFSNLFDKVLYMFRTCTLSIIRSISTLYTRNRYLSFYTYFCWLADANGTRILEIVHLVGFHYRNVSRCTILNVKSKNFVTCRKNNLTKPLTRRR